MAHRVWLCICLPQRIRTQVTCKATLALATWVYHTAATHSLPLIMVALHVVSCCALTSMKEPCMLDPQQSTVEESFYAQQRLINQEIHYTYYSARISDITYTLFVPLIY